MPREMFGDVVDPSIKVGTKQWYTVPLSIITHVVVLGALIVIPLLATDMLPTPQSVMAFVAVPPPPPPPPPPAAAASGAAASPQPVAVVNPNAAPIEAPKEIKPEPPPRRLQHGRRRRRRGRRHSRRHGRRRRRRHCRAAPPPPPPQAPVRVGGDIKEPKKIKNVSRSIRRSRRPRRSQGIVIIEAIIGKDGSVKDAKVLRSVPMLDQAALDAVRQWRYTPTLLNSQPVEVVMTVTVNFTLN